MTYRLLCLLAGLAIATGCASDPARRQKIVAEETARMRAPETPLAAFGTFELMPVAMSPEVSADEGKTAVASQLGEKLEARLRPLIQEWASNGSAQARGRTLAIQPTVMGLKVVSGGARFFAGALAGDSFIDMDLTLVDKQSGRPIAKERIKQSSGAIAGAWSVGSTDRNLADYVVDIAHRYLVNNYKP